MKIYNWIDSLFDTKEKRKKWVLWVSALYLLWQFIWLDVFFYKLAQVRSYDTLFTFMSTMNIYSNNVLIRIVFSLIAGNHIDFSGLASAIYNNVYLFDYIMIGISVLAICTRKKGYICAILACSYFMFLCGILIAGLSSMSVSFLIILLQVLAYTSLTLFSVLTIYLLYKLVRSIHLLYEI